MDFQSLNELVISTRCTRRFNQKIEISKKDLENILIGSF